MFVKSFADCAGLDDEAFGDAVDGFAGLMSSDDVADLVSGEGVVAHCRAVAFEDPADGLAVDAELLGELVDGRSGFVGGYQCDGSVAGELGQNLCWRLLFFHRWLLAGRCRRAV